MGGSPEDIHVLVLRTVGSRSLMEPDLHPLVEQGLKGLPARFPGLKVVRHEIRNEELELTLELHRLDEDIQRIVQSFKSEVGNLARKDRSVRENFWRWGFEEK